MKRRVLALVLAVTMFVAMSITTLASGNATVSFTSDNKLVYGGVTETGEGKVNLGDAFKDVAPGETRTQTITLVNENDRTADFYMSTAVLDALENMNASEGDGKAKGAGYDIELTVEGIDEPLYSSKVGGYNGAEGEEKVSAHGIDAMNGALKDYVLVATLAKGKTAQVALTIAFDGEAMDNTGDVDYSLTDGQLAFNFQVGYEEPSGEVIVREVSEDGQISYVRKIVEIVENKVPLGAVATGDGAMVGLAAVVLLVGSSLVVMGRKKKTEE